MRFIVLSSSRGTTFKAVLECIADGSLAAECLGLVADRADRGCVEIAREFHLPVAIVERGKGEAREDYDARLGEAILSFGRPDILACLGWMRLFSPAFVKRWRRRLLNVHPSLLPQHPGAHAHEEVLAAGETTSGMTIHFIDEGVDTGEIILRKECPVMAGDTVDTLKARVQELEKEWCPKVLQMLHTGELQYGC